MIRSFFRRASLPLSALLIASSSHYANAATPASGDVVPPLLLVSVPGNGEANVAVNTTVTFVFNEPMLPLQSIQWSGNVDPTKMSYSWLPGAMALSCQYQGGFPGETTISWTLNSTPGGALNFRDAAGNELPTQQGSFTTAPGGDPGDPCDDPTNPGEEAGYAQVYRVVNHIQTGNNTPLFDAETGAVFGGSYHSPDGETASEVILTGPGEIEENLFLFFGDFLFLADFDSVAALDSEFPAGDYTLAASIATGDRTVTLTLGESSAVDVPQILNLVEMASLNPANPFTLNFNGITAAGLTDSISIQISDDTGTVFQAPDFCEGIELAGTATSVVIPANTFETGQTYEGTISFSRGTEMISTPGFFGFAVVSAVTRFEFTVGGSVTPTAPMFLTPVRNPDGTLDFPVASDTGAVVNIYGTTDFQTWTLVSTEVAASGNITVRITPGTTGHRYFRASVE